MSDEEENLSTDESESESEEDMVVEKVLDRDHDDLGLMYLVQLRGYKKEEWVNRSDLWDDAGNSRKIEAYDFRNPVDWDENCEFCEAPFEGPEAGNSGCEECRCDICDAPCRHFLGRNYGCPEHPVI